MLAHLTAERGPLAGSTFVVKPGAPFLIGSGPGVQVKLPAAAARHAALTLGAKGLEVIDLGGGVTLDGAPLEVRKPRQVGSGQAIALLDTLLRVELDGVPEPARAAPAPPAAPTLEGFDVLGTLGKGGMGTVLHARRQQDGREVAVKVMNDDLVPGSPDHKRFVVEGRVGMRVQSPYVVQTLDCRVDSRGRAMIVMELVRGPSLMGWLASNGPLSVASALAIVEHAAHGIAAAHGAGVLHRDIKPANLLLAPEGVAKLTDFGIAKDLQWTLDSLTKSGMGLGTIGYMAPEQIASARAVDVSADLYALGGTLYHALTGRPPLIVRVMHDLPRLIAEPPPAVRSLRPDCPAPVEALVHQLLAKDPFDRPPSAVEVARRLRELQSS